MKEDEESYKNHGSQDKASLLCIIKSVGQIDPAYSGKIDMCLGIPGRIVKIVDRDRMLATAEISGVRRDVNVACVAVDPLESLLGKWVLIHVGFAMSAISETEARATLEALEDLDETREAHEAIEASQHALDRSQ